MDHTKVSSTTSRGRSKEPRSGQPTADKVAACRAEARKRQLPRDNHSSTSAPPKRRRGGNYNDRSGQRGGIYVDFGAGLVKLSNPFHNMVGFGIRKGLDYNNDPQNE